MCNVYPDCIYRVILDTTTQRWSGLTSLVIAVNGLPAGDITITYEQNCSFVIFSACDNNAGFMIYDSGGSPVLNGYGICRTAD